jgi:putative ABC transport system permease protein
MYWTWETGIGVGFAITAVMAVVVGTVVVGQTIYSATIEHLREFGTLKAIGATNRFIYMIVIEQALLQGVLGYGTGLLVALGVMHALSATGLVLVLPPVVLGAVFLLTLLMCMSASLVSVRKVVRLDPMIVFRA